MTWCRNHGGSYASKTGPFPNAKERGKFANAPPKRQCTNGKALPRALEAWQEISENSYEIAISSMSVYFSRMLLPTVTETRVLNDEFMALQADTFLLDGKPRNHYESLSIDVMKTPL